MKNLCVFAVLIASTFQQESLYYPLAPGNAWTYKNPDGSFEDNISDEKFTYKGVDYLQNIRKYSDGTANISCYRIENDGTVYYLDTESFYESIEIPAIPRKSFTWTSTDNKWKYEIVDIHTELKTPGHTFKDCLAIKAERDRVKEVYINYYSKGIGFVGSRMNGELIVYLMKWKLKEKKG